MNQYNNVCTKCKKKNDPEQFWYCKYCGGSIVLEYNNKISNVPQYPLKETVTWSDGVGNTPLIILKNISKSLGVTIYAKCENQNPTGSFKDRGSVIEVLKAKELNKKGVICASTGNMALSLSSFAAKQNIRCVDVVPAWTNNLKIKQMKRCGGDLILVDGPYDKCVDVAVQYAKEKNYFLCGDYALRKEGQKIIGWEIAQSQIKFDALIVPVGNGNLGVALYKGLSESQRLKTERLPKCIAVQPALANPIKVAIEDKKEIIAQFPQKRTTAAAFDVGSPLDGFGVIELVNKTNGSVFDVTDEEMITTQREIAEKEGLIIEETTTAAFVILKKLSSQYQNKTIGIILTGSGLSDS